MKKIFLLISLFIITIPAFSQVGGTISGNFQTIVQSYTNDTLIGATQPDDKIRMNSYADFIYTNNNFTAGVRYEGYFNPILGYNPRNDGFGFPYKFAEYTLPQVDITAGNFYEQFGNGLVLRSFMDKNIGYDNALNGIRIKYNPVKGIYLTGLMARERYSFSKTGKGYSQLIDKGLVRGIDMEFDINETFKKFDTAKTHVLLGFSFVSKYQKTQNQYVTINDTTYSLELPENTAAMSSRLNISRGGFAFSGEFAYKSQDPSLENGFIYKPGTATFLNFSYSRKGFGFILSGIRIDNFGFRADRNATLSDLNINYIPDITRNHIYSFAAMYPFVTQNNGEEGIASELTYKVPRHSKLGGKYGIDIRINYSRIHNIYKKEINKQIPINQAGTNGYISNFFKIGDEIYYQDFDIQIYKKFSTKFKVNFIYQNEIFNFAVLRGEPGEPRVYANIFIWDMTFRLKPKHYLRFETEALFSHQDMGSWLMQEIEYTISPHWFFSASDQYNYANPQNKEAHYYMGSFGYKTDNTRFQLSYGRQREGVICIGGVCRQVPATNGFMLSITSSF